MDTKVAKVKPHPSLRYLYLNFWDSEDAIQSLLQASPGVTKLKLYLFFSYDHYKKLHERNVLPEKLQELRITDDLLAHHISHHHCFKFVQELTLGERKNTRITHKIEGFLRGIVLQTE